MFLKRPTFWLWCAAVVAWVSIGLSVSYPLIRDHDARHGWTVGKRVNCILVAALGGPPIAAFVTAAEWDTPAKW